MVMLVGLNRRRAAHVNVLEACQEFVVDIVLMVSAVFAIDEVNAPLLSTRDGGSTTVPFCRGVVGRMPVRGEA
jgi:hypothetical protein